MAPRTPLLNPLDYYERPDRPSLSVGAGVVLVQSLALVVAMWLFVQQVIDRFDASAGATAAAQASVTDELVLYFVASFVGWLILAAVLHVFVWFANGNRGFGTTLAITGEAHLASLVLFPVALFVLFSAIGGIPQDPDGAITYFQETAPLQSPVLDLSRLVGTIWQAVIAGYGLSIAHGIDRDKAFVLTFAVGLLGYLLNLLG